MASSSYPAGFSPLEWFGALSPAGKLDFLRQLAAAMDVIDPDGSKRRDIWGRNKTVRLEVGLPLADGATVNGVGAHFALDGTIELWRSFLLRLDRGMIEFSPGTAYAEGFGGPQPGWVASLGVGSLQVNEHLGELLVLVTQRQVVPVPQPLKTGLKAPFELPPQEGFLVALFEGQITFIGGYNKLRRGEVKAARTAPIKVGIAKASDTLLMFGLHAPGLAEGWLDLPFSLAIERPENRRVNPPDTDGTRTILLVVADRQSGIVATVRPLRLSASWSATLEGMLETQELAIGRYTKADYMREVQAAYARWPTPNHMAKDFAAVEKAVDLLPPHQR